MVCIRVDTTDAEKGKLRIEVITGGNSDGILTKRSLFGGEKHRIKAFAKELQTFCDKELINVAD